MLERIKALFKKKKEYNHYTPGLFMMSLPLIDPFCKNVYGKSSMDMNYDELQIALKDFNNRILGNDDCLHSSMR